MDYPGKIASVVFTQGCNFSCPYCHNRELIPVNSGTFPPGPLFNYLERNRLLLDGVVITGGEPTLHSGLPDFIKAIKALGLSVKLDTNGTNLQMLDYLIRQDLVDYIAMDVKSSLDTERYSLTAGIRLTEKLLDRIKESVRLIIGSGVDHEFRTTICRELVRLEDIDRIIPDLHGCRRYFWQQYHSYNQDKVEPVQFSPYPEVQAKQFIENRKSRVRILFRD